jgi:DNA-binding response OmpR family regulator
MQNAISALNKNADGYFVKPVDVKKLLKMVKEQLQLQENEREFSERKVTEFIETRVKEL